MTIPRIVHNHSCIHDIHEKVDKIIDILSDSLDKESIVDYGYKSMDHTFNINVYPFCLECVNKSNGETLYVCSCSTGYIAYSYDLKNWTSKNISSVTYDGLTVNSKVANPIYVITGGSDVRWYKDIETITDLKNGYIGRFNVSGVNFTPVLYISQNEIYIAGGGSSTIGTGVLYYSPADVNTGEPSTSWTSIKTNGEISDIRFIYYDSQTRNTIALGNNGTIVYSPTVDITTSSNVWTKVDLGNVTTNLQCMCYNPDKKEYIVIGDNGFIMRSETIAEGWEILDIGNNSHLQTIVYDSLSKCYILVSYGGLIMMTDDVYKPWNIVDTGHTKIYQAITYDSAHNKYICAGEYVITIITPPVRLQFPTITDWYNKTMYPVGSSIRTFNPSNPNSYLGFGTWSKSEDYGIYTFTRIE